MRPPCPPVSSSAPSTRLALAVGLVFALGAVPAARAQFILSPIAPAPTIASAASASLVTNGSNCYSYLGFLGPGREVRYATHLEDCTIVDGVWQIDDTIGRLGNEVSLAVDLASSTPHLAVATYEGASDPDWVTYVTKSGSGAWQYEHVLERLTGDQIASATGVSISIGNGVPCVAFVVHKLNGSELLCFATRISQNNWTLQEVLTSSDLMQGVTLRMNGSTPHVIFHQTGGTSPSRLEYVTKVAGVWTSPETIDLAFGPGALALSNGVPSVVYSQSAYVSGVFYAVRSAGVWQPTLIHNELATGSSRVLSLTFDSSNKPHVAFTGISGEVHYVYKNGTSWISRDVDYAGASDATVAIGVATFMNLKRPRIAYLSQSGPSEYHWAEGTNPGGPQLGMRPDPEVTAAPGVWWIRPLSESAPGGEAMFQLSLPQQSRVELSAFDLAGRVVGSRPSELFSAGEHQVSWGMGNLASGTYFVRMIADSKARATARLVVRR